MIGEVDEERTPLLWTAETQDAPSAQPVEHLVVAGVALQRTEGDCEHRIIIIPLPLISELYLKVQHGESYDNVPKAKRQLGDRNVRSIPTRTRLKYLCAS